MNLIIVESPTKARTLSRFLGNDYRIEATMGHIRDLPKSKFGVDVEHDFTPEYVVSAGKKKNLDTIEQASKKANKIYLATDPDREGEAIAWHVGRLLGYWDNRLLGKRSKLPATKQPSNPVLQRIVFHEITDSAVRHALDNPRDIDMDLVDAQTARRVLDRLVGYKLSPLLWKKVRIGLSAGRVQSVAVRLIVEREREIEAFRSEEYWEIFCEVTQRVLPSTLTGPAARSSRPTSSVRVLMSDLAGVRRDPLRSRHPYTFLVKLIKINGEKAEIKNKQQTDKIVSDLEKSDYRVEGVEKKEINKSPYPPFTTSTMTQAAARLFYWSAKRTMQIAQKLYEEGLITYHRTDSTNLASEAISKVRDFINKEYGKEYVPEKPRFYKTTSKVAQEAHEAVRPTDVSNKLQITNKQSLAFQAHKLGGNAEKLYNLIWKRFVACQMANAVYDETTIDVEAGNYLLQAKGQINKFAGWRKVYGGLDREEVQLPQVAKDEQLKLIKVLPEQKFTEPPARYNEASLIKTLEKLGIGRPSTYAPIISTIEVRKYVEKIDPSAGSGRGSKFRPTPVGVAVNDFLLANFPDVFDYQFTAKMEDNLDEIANGKVKWVPVIREFWQPFDKKLEKVEETTKRVKIEVEKTGEACPECKTGEQVVRIGRFGRFLSCSRFPECKWTEQYVEKIGMKCPGCNSGDVIIRKTKKGRQFYGCSRFPECKWASWRKPKFSS